MIHTPCMEVKIRYINSKLKERHVLIEIAVSLFVYFDESRSYNAGNLKVNVHKHT